MIASLLVPLRFKHTVSWVSIVFKFIGEVYGRPAEKSSSSLYLNLTFITAKALEYEHLLCYAAPMHDIDHFYSELDSLAKRYHTDTDLLLKNASFQFTKLVSPIVGSIVCEDIINWWSEQYGRTETPQLEPLGAFAAFFCGEFDAERMKLSTDDLEALREAINAEAVNIDIETLTRLMNDLVELGAI
jgi:hypothetical protein